VGTQPNPDYFVSQSVRQSVRACSLGIQRKKAQAQEIRLIFSGKWNRPNKSIE